MPGGVSGCYADVKVFCVSFNKLLSNYKGVVGGCQVVAFWLSHKIRLPNLHDILVHKCASYFLQGKKILEFLKSLWFEK